MRSWNCGPIPQLLCSSCNPPSPPRLSNPGVSSSRPIKPWWQQAQVETQSLLRWMSVSHSDQWWWCIQRSGHPGGGPPDDNNLDFNDPLPDLEPEDNEEAYHDKEQPQDPLVQLAQAIQSLAHVSCHPTSSFAPCTKIQESDQFDRMDPCKLQVFLIQCELNFQDCPRAFSTDCAKVMFAQSDIGIASSDQVQRQQRRDEPVREKLTWCLILLQVDWGAITRLLGVESLVFRVIRTQLIYIQSVVCTSGWNYQ